MTAVFYTKYSSRQNWVNNVDRDQTQQKLRLIRVYTVCYSSSLDTSTDSKINVFKIGVKFG